jgi:hypothetical protein
MDDILQRKLEGFGDLKRQGMGVWSEIAKMGRKGKVKVLVSTCEH